MQAKAVLGEVSRHKNNLHRVALKTAISEVVEGAYAAGANTHS